MPNATNSTILTLVPKFPGAASIKDYRPISCCNTLYKTISKILVGKIKPILPKLILPNQTAFIKGRLLLENTLLASELVNGYHLDKGTKKLTIKVDIAKAFDTLRWDFIINCLLAHDFPQTYIAWIKECITTPSFSIGINGTLHGFFKSNRGLRQGDPLSPYLFGIAMNVLSHQLNIAASIGRFGFHPNCKDSKLTHLCFADDLLIFSDGTISSVKGILEVLAEFQTLSGLAISPQKSSFFSSCLSPIAVAEIETVSGIPRGYLPVRYLGLPLTTKKLSLVNCEPLLQRIKGKLGGWTVKHLSFAGRLQLLDSTISGITNFWCGSFVSARVAWDVVTSPKCEGGLGIKNLLIWNVTCSIKLIWLLIFNTDSIWAAWIHQNVIKDKDFWSMTPQQSHTWTFRYLLKLRQTATRWFMIRPGDGRTCRFWTHPWTPFGSLIKFIGDGGPRLTGIRSNATVGSVWNGEWMLPAARSDRIEELLTYLTTLSLDNSQDENTWIVDGKPRTSFCAGEIYNALRDQNAEVIWWKIVWIKRGIPKHKTTTWLFLLNRCPTRDRMIGWGLNVNPICLLCNSVDETRDHLFFACNFSGRIWSPLATKIQPAASTLDWNQLINTLTGLTGDGHRRYLLLLAWQAAIYEIWSERNNRLHRNTRRSTNTITRRIEFTIKNRISASREQNPAKASSILQLWFSLV